MIVYDQLGRTWKEAVMVYFKISHNLPEGTENFKKS